MQLLNHTTGVVDLVETPFPIANVLLRSDSRAHVPEGVERRRALPHHHRGLLCRPFAVIVDASHPVEFHDEAARLLKELPKQDLHIHVHVSPVAQLWKSHDQHVEPECADVGDCKVVEQIAELGPRGKRSGTPAKITCWKTQYTNVIARSVHSNRVSRLSPPLMYVQRDTGQSCTSKTRYAVATLRNSPPIEARCRPSTPDTNTFSRVVHRYPSRALRR
jgi:hypothetical protein